LTPFQDYITEKHNKSEVKQILEIHNSEHNRELLELSRNLLIWSFIGFAIDVLVFGSAGLLTLKFGFGLATIWPSIIFLIVNLIAKYIYVRRFTENRIGAWLTIKAILPYLGSVLIIQYLADKNELYVEAFKGYLKEFKKQITWKNVSTYVKEYFR